MRQFQPVPRLTPRPLAVAACCLAIAWQSAAAEATHPGQDGVARDSTWGLVGAGDKLVVRVLGQPAWSDSTLVDASGDVVLTRVGRLHVAGLALGALRDTVRGRYAEILRNPDVDLLFLRRVAVLGAVRKPDLLFVDPAATLRDVLAQAGGIDDEGDPNKVEIVRDGRRIPLGKWRDTENATVPVRSGDQVLVGRRSWIARNSLTAISSLAVAVSVLVTAFGRR